MPTTRHRIPTIFNLSMVDVLCCALGCVILLWLLNLREAKQKSLAAGKTSELLTRAETELKNTGQQLASTQARAEAALSASQAALRERDQLRHDLDAVQGRLAESSRAAAALRADRASLAERLAKKAAEQENATKEITAARQRLSALDVLVRDKETQARAAAQQADDLRERLRDLDARTTQLRSQAARDARASRDKGAAADTRIRDLEQLLADRNRELAGAGRAIEGLEKERKTLGGQVAKARAAADNRFAGIALTGRRVVFLVDMSGSMELVDDNTLAPEKWLGVRQTMARIMRSLPDLERFQVILFSNKVVTPLGSEGRWIDYDAVTSPTRVAGALAAIKPSGNTDMYSGFAAAFRYRPLGLDTIYVFSDGLPNIGEGLTTEAAQTLKETEKAEILSRRVRQMLRSEWNASQPGQPKVRINTIGFFFESPDVGAFLWALARENDGSFVGMSRP